MKRHDPLGRLLDPLVQLAGGFLLYVPGGSCGGESERWMAIMPAGTKIGIPITSTFREAQALLAAGMESARG